jgi:hypothetical protein
MLQADYNWFEGENGMFENLSIYDVKSTLSAIDANLIWLLVFGGGSLIFNFLFFGAAIANGFKDKAVSMPIGSTLIFFAHDLLYLLMFDKWFGVYQHWFPMLFWVGLVITLCMECVFLYITIKFGRTEHAPQLTQNQYRNLVLAAVVGVFIAWLPLKYALADELWLFTFGWTVWFCTPFVIPMMLRRNSTAGQSLLMWYSYMGMAICYWMAMWPLDPFFRSPLWLGLLPVILLSAAAIIFTIKKLPRPAAGAIA